MGRSARRASARSTRTRPPATPSKADGGSAQKEMVVARRIEDVFAVVADLESYVHWTKGLEKVEVVERDEGSDDDVRQERGPQDLSERAEADGEVDREEDSGRAGPGGGGDEPELGHRRFFVVLFASRAAGSPLGGARLDYLLFARPMICASRPWRRQLPGHLTQRARHR